MFMIKRIPKRVIFLILICAAALIFLCLADAALSKGNTAQVLSLEAGSDEKNIQFLSQFGWEVESQPVEISEVVIPEVFDNVYSTYNQLQQVQGFDLRDFKGAKVKRYSYRITNYPDGIENVRANILVLDNKVIGGDVCSMAIGGFMHGFKLSASTTGIIGEQCVAVMEAIE